LIFFYLYFLFHLCGLHHNELFISLLVLCLIITTFLIKYEKNEIYLLLLGIMAGIIAEIGGDYFNKVQYWEQGSFFGVPFWLTIIMGIWCEFILEE
jgi:hypothetical protein